MDKNFLFGIGVTNAATEDILKYIITSLEKKGERYYIVTPNPEILVYATKHPSFASILDDARLALPDGIGVIWAGKILGKKFKERVTGVDLVEMLCKEVSKKPITVGFLGGKDKVAEKTAECLRQKYPGLKVVFASPEWPDNEKEDDRRLKIEDSTLKMENRKWINPRPSTFKNLPSTFYHLSSSIDILFVAFGFPKQEEWMAKHLGKIPVKVMMGIGGSFDYLSGNVSRAPLPIRLIGFEWLFRLIRQPWRWRRQIALLEFIWIALKEKFKV